MGFIKDCINEEPLCGTCMKVLICDIFREHVLKNGDWRLLPSECDYYKKRKLECL